MEKTKDELQSHRDALATTLLLILALALTALCGCASYTVRDGKGNIVSKGEAMGFLRTITVTEVYENGQIKERKISTDSTTKDALMGLESLIDTTVNTASKLKP